MLINQSELQTMCLKRKAQEELTAQVINQLNGIADPLVRYATSRALKDVFTTATSECGAAAVDYCHTKQLGMDGNHFPHLGLEFSLEYKCDFDYKSNDFDPKFDPNNEGKKPIGYRQHVMEQEAIEKQLKAIKAKVKTDELTIETLHPRMAPLNPRWTMKFYMKEL